MPKYEKQKRATLNAAAEMNRGMSIPDAPICLYLEVSNICNLKCAFCQSFSAINPKRLSALKAEDRGFFDLSRKGNLDELLARALTVYLFGFGEPTIHPEFLDLVRYVGSFETQIEFVTNGMNLTDEIIEAVVDNRVRQIMISFSGSTKLDYESLYLNGDFEKVLSSIAKLNEEKKKKNSQYPLIMINSIAFKHHIEHLPDFIDLMGAHGANIVNVNNLSMNSAFPEMYHHACVYSPDKHEQIIEETRRRAERWGIILGMDNFLRDAAITPLQEVEFLQNRMSGKMPDSIRKIDLADMQTYAAGIKAEKPAPRARKEAVVPQTEAEAVNMMKPGDVPGADHMFCMEPFRVAYIKRDGNVNPCCLWPDRELSFGNISSMTTKEMWNSPAFKLTRKSIINQSDFPDGCKYCVKSKIAPEDAQLWQAISFIDWYREGFGVDISDSFPSGPLASAEHIATSLRSPSRHNSPGIFAKAAVFFRAFIHPSSTSH